MTLSCPSCHSENTQKLSVIYEEGLSHINTKTRSTGVGFARGGMGIGFGRGKTRGTSQSSASLKASPPTKLSMTWGVVLVVLGVIFIRGSFLWLAAIGLGGWLIYRAYKFNHEQWPELFAKWDRAFQCLRCGTIFEASMMRTIDGQAAVTSIEGGHPSIPGDRNAILSQNDGGHIR